MKRKGCCGSQLSPWPIRAVVFGLWQTERHTQCMCVNKDSQITAWMKEREEERREDRGDSSNWTLHDTQEEQERKGRERKKQEGDPLVPVSPTLGVKHSPNGPASSF